MLKIIKIAGIIRIVGIILESVLLEEIRCVKIVVQVLNNLDPIVGRKSLLKFSHLQ